MKGHKLRRPDHERHSYEEIARRFRLVDGRLQRIKCGRCKDKLGSVKTTGYVFTRIDRKDYSVHSLTFFLHHKRWAVEIDHIDDNKQNNHISNLEEVTRKDNQSRALGLPVVRGDGQRFDCASDAMRAIGAHVNNVSHLLRAIRSGRKAYGFTWRFA